MAEADAGGLRLRVGLWPAGSGVCRDEFLFGDTETGLLCIACSRISFTKSDVSTPPGILSLPFLPTSLLSCFASLMCSPPKSLPPGNGAPTPSGTIGGMLCNPPPAPPWTGPAATAGGRLLILAELTELLDPEPPGSGAALLLLLIML